MFLKKKIPIIMIVCMLLFSCFNISYARDSKTITIPISHKMLDLETSETFNFIMEKTTEDAPDPVDSTKSIKGNGEEKFDITLEEVGRFDYIIREVEGKNKSVKYDKTIYKVIVLSKFNKTGEVETSVVLEDGSQIKPEKVEFVDKSNATATVKPIIKKTITDNNDYNDKFTFKLQGENKTLFANIKGEGTTAFEELKFNKPGEYNYSVYEVKNDKTDWNYDEIKYQYIVTVTEKNGNLIAKSNYSEFKFTNKPTIIRKAKRLTQVISNGGNNSKTGDSNRYLRYAFFVALIALATLVGFGVGKHKKK